MSEALKRQVAQAALAYVPAGEIIGVGSGSTVNCFIDALSGAGLGRFGVVSASDASSARLAAAGIRIVEAGAVERLSVYIDGADEIDATGCMIKGGGAALTREKIVADLADRFVCIADASKRVARLGRFALPVEVVPMAVAQIARRFAAMGGDAKRREGVVTDNGGALLDVHGLAIDDPLGLEREVNQWPGVVCVGVFARNRAALCLLATPQGVETLHF